MSERVPEICDFTRSSHQTNRNHPTYPKCIDLKIEENIKELQALHLNSKLIRAQKQKSIKRAAQLAADLNHINRAIELQKTKIVHLKSQILHIDNELAKYSTVGELTDAEKEIRKLKERLLNNNREQNSSKNKAYQLNAVVMDLLMKRQQFLATRNNLIAELMAKKQKNNEMFNIHTIPSAAKSDPVQEQERCTDRLSQIRTADGRNRSCTYWEN